MHPEINSPESVGKEEWRSIGISCYMVSNLGRVSGYRNKVLSLHPNKRGHLVVYLIRDGKTVGRLVHRLVAAAFIGDPPSNSMDCRHLDGVPGNNIPSNLAWGTRLENIRDMIRHRGRTSNASMSYERARQIREMIGPGRGEQARVSRETGVPKGIINKIFMRKIYALEMTTDSCLPHSEAQRDRA